MRGGSVSNGVRLVQIFLTKDKSPKDSGIYEVSVNSDIKAICNCYVFRTSNKCKHADIVTARLNDDGDYPFEFSERASKEEGKRANESNENFRDFIIKYGKIEVV